MYFFSSFVIFPDHLGEWKRFVIFFSHKPIYLVSSFHLWFTYSLFVIFYIDFSCVLFPVLVYWIVSHKSFAFPASNLPTTSLVANFFMSHYNGRLFCSKSSSKKDILNSTFLALKLDHIFVLSNCRYFNEFQQYHRLWWFYQSFRKPWKPLLKGFLYGAY